MRKEKFIIARVDKPLRYRFKRRCKALDLKPSEALRGFVAWFTSIDRKQAREWVKEARE